MRRRKEVDGEDFEGRHEVAGLEDYRSTSVRPGRAAVRSLSFQGGRPRSLSPGERVRRTRSYPCFWLGLRVPYSGPPRSILWGAAGQNGT